MYGCWATDAIEYEWQNQQVLFYHMPNEKKISLDVRLNL